MKITGESLFPFARDETWGQFTVYPPACANKFQPLQALTVFLPLWFNRAPTLTAWHILFEPSALVRFQSENIKGALAAAQSAADLCGLDLVWGDASALQRNGDGITYGGEADIYGKELWEANKRFMQACGDLSVALAKNLPDENVWPLRKFQHLFLNIMGLNYLEEAAFHQHCAERALELYKKYGRG